MKRFLPLVIASSFAIFSTSPALAANVNGWYVGTGVGAAHASIDTNDTTTAANKVEKNTMGAKIVTGYQYNQNFALQANYLYLGQNKYESSTAASDGSFRTSVLSANVIGLLPLADQFDAHVGVGIYRSFVNLSSGMLFKDSSDKPDNMYGIAYSLGAKYDITPSMSFSVDWDQLLEGTKNTLLSGNIRYYFSS